ncbi:MAG: proliferating cell nuclear antigen (pcna) [Candidatus Woesearchaeota archaeon]|nr:MAG: proliferating cell nuclear antigen (pcna) [Candidatus Woesearchaeota archaeon]
MRLTLSEPRLLKDSITIISDLVTETSMKFTSDGLELVAIDPANVAMVIFKLLSSCFVEYDIKEPQTIAINLNNLKQVLRRAGPNDTLTLELKDSKLHITLKAKTKRSFQLPLLEMDEQEQRVPGLTFSSTIVTLSSSFAEAIDDMDIVGESVTLQTEKNKFIIASQNDLTKADVEMEGDDTTKIVVEKEAKSKYSIEYLKKIMQGSKLADKMTLKFSDDYPLNIEYKQLNKLELSFVLAPRVDND